jgi:hypothetical protein
MSSLKLNIPLKKMLFWTALALGGYRSFENMLPNENFFFIIGSRETIFLNKQSTMMS